MQVEWAKHWPASFVRAGHYVNLANSRGPESSAKSSRSWGLALRPARRRMSLASAMWSLSPPDRDQIPSAVSALRLEGKVVIDTTNNRIGRTRGACDLGGRSSSEVVAEFVPGAHLVKAFNHQPIAALDGVPLVSSVERKALFIAGENRDAKNSFPP